MHTEIEVIVPSSYTDELIDNLQQMDDVISLSVVREASIKPPGDVFRSLRLREPRSLRELIIDLVDATSPVRLRTLG